MRFWICSPNDSGLAVGASARVAEVELLEKRDTAASLRQLPRRARSDDTAADDGYIGLLRRHRTITVCELLRRRLSLSLTLASRRASVDF